MCACASMVAHTTNREEGMSFVFEETMCGFITPGAGDFVAGFDEGRQRKLAASI